MSATDTVTDNTYHQNQQKPELTQAELNTQFIDAAQNGQAYRVRQLLEEGADVNCMGLSQHGAGNDPDKIVHCTALQIATFLGHRAVVHTLIAGGAQVNMLSRNPYWCNASALYYASTWGQTDIVRVLLNAGARAGMVFESGKTCLHAAAMLGREDIVEMLLEAGADPNACNNQGLTPLDVAEIGVSNDKEALIRVLKRYGGRNCCHNGH